MISPSRDDLTQLPLSWPEFVSRLREHAEFHAQNSREPVESVVSQARNGKPLKKRFSRTARAGGGGGSGPEEIAHALREGGGLNRTPADTGSDIGPHECVVLSSERALQATVLP
ncbi:hypothetical protein SKAU_G00315020 [Synaphobranchus kaupii]|uniref:Uncharacterized protein n=1 Tax=Synaphobranchus kaupii TaxID=118154 RepID=A0A9Q1ILF5_SYNKA|nr:hypothetical protein SKAU_G00315020 [Synaphobranchus kaupii]